MYQKFKNMTLKQKIIFTTIAFLISMPIIIFIAMLILVFTPIIAGTATLIFIVLAFIKKKQMKKYVTWAIISVFVSSGSYALADSLFGSDNTNAQSESEVMIVEDEDTNDDNLIETHQFHQNDAINEVLTRLNDYYQLDLTKEDVTEKFSDFKASFKLDGVLVEFVDNSDSLYIDYEFESINHQTDTLIETFRKFMTILGVSLTNEQFNEIVTDLKTGNFRYDNRLTVNDCEFSLSDYLSNGEGTRYRLRTRISKSELFKTELHEYTLIQSDESVNETPEVNVEALQPQSTETKVHFIDTGHSDSILIENNGQYALIDAGDRDDDAKVKAYLRNQGVNRLEYLIITHFHADHFGGADTVINDFEVGTTLVPNGDADTQVYRDFIYALSNKGLASSVPREGATFSLGNATLTLYNTSGNHSNENNDSLVTLLQSGSKKALFTGDAESEVEQRLSHIGDVDLFKAGHHGSNTSNTLTLLNQITPEYVVIMAGANNKYGHPHAEVMNRFENLGIPVYRTDEQGDIVFTLSEEGVTTDKSPGSYQSAVQTGSSTTSSQNYSTPSTSNNESISSSNSSTSVKVYSNCKQLNADYPHGINKWDYPELYNANTRRDGDGDGYACER